MLLWNQKIDLAYATLNYMATNYMEYKSPAAPRSIGRSLNFAASTGSAVANDLLAPHGLGLAQWAVLSSIWRNGPLSVKQIAEVTGNAPPAASRLIERMVKNGMLAREQDKDDRRAVVVNVTAKGESLRDLASIYEQVNAVLLRDLSEDEAALLFDLLERVQKTGRDWLANSNRQSSE